MVGGLTCGKWQVVLSAHQVIRGAWNLSAPVFGSVTPVESNRARGAVRLEIISTLVSSC